MHRQSSATIVLALLFLIGFAPGFQSSAQTPSSQVVLENEFVLVTQVDIGPGTKSSYTVMSGRSAVVIRLTLPNPAGNLSARQRDTAFHLDRFLFLAGGDVSNHSEPSSGSAFREIHIELKSVPSAPPFANDAVALDPAHNNVLLENDRVRIVHIQFPLGERGPNVDKRPRVIILLTDMHAQVLKPGGTPEPRDGTAGTIYWSLGGSQATINRNETFLDNIVIELKRK